VSLIIEIPAAQSSVCAEVEKRGRGNEEKENRSKTKTNMHEITCLLGHVAY